MNKWKYIYNVLDAEDKWIENERKDRENKEKNLKKQKIVQFSRWN